MKVFISWSGELSHKVAVVLKDWLPLVIQSVEAYVSSEDIDKGARWSSDISKALEESFFGVLCITSDNIDAPWINFEAGALSKSFEKSRISPFLFGITRAQVQGPLLQFQSTIFERDDVKKLVISINKASDGVCLEDQRLEKMFEVLWPQLEEDLNKLLESGSGVKDKQKEKKSSKDEQIEEVLLLVRNQQQLLSNPENLLPKAYFDYLFRRSGEDIDWDHPAFMDIIQIYYEIEKQIPVFIIDGDNIQEPLINIIDLKSLGSLIKKMKRSISYLERRVMKKNRIIRQIGGRVSRTCLEDE